MRKQKFKEVRWLSKYLWWNIMSLEIPCTPVQWRENWTKCQEMCVTLISEWPAIRYASLCKYECVCIGNWIRISKPQILRHLTLKNFFFSLLSPGVDIHVVTQSPRPLPSHGSALLKSSPQSHLHWVSRWGERMKDFHWPGLGMAYSTSTTFYWL